MNYEGNNKPFTEALNATDALHLWLKGRTSETNIITAEAINSDIVKEILNDEQLLLTHRFAIAEEIIFPFSTNPDCILYTENWLLGNQHGLSLIRIIGKLQPLAWDSLSIIAHNPQLFSTTERTEAYPVIPLTTPFDGINDTSTLLEKLTGIELLLYRKVLDPTQTAGLFNVLIKDNLLSPKWAGRILKVLLYNNRVNNREEPTQIISDYIRKELDLPDDLPDEWIAEIV
jgi:hypothetical protein